MNSSTSSFQTNLSSANFWIRNMAWLVVLSILTNHLVQPENFPLNESYSFPWINITVSVVLGGLIMILADLNFHYYKRKYFIERIDAQILTRFMLTTLGYISLIYVPIFYTLNGIDNHYLYSLLTGYTITLLLCTIGITLVYARDIYTMYRFNAISGKLKVASGGKITLIGFDEIAYVYSEHKIAYLVKVDGSLVATDFTLNEIEEKINEHSFYRANRQTVLHASSIEQVKPIENGKLSVVLKPTLPGKEALQVTISRYKKQEFLDWFEKKS